MTYLCKLFVKKKKKKNIEIDYKSRSRGVARAAKSLRWRV